MIGVIASGQEKESVAEFFQLFKTPWEFYRSGRDYAVLITTQADAPGDQSKLVICFEPGGELKSVPGDKPAAGPGPIVLLHEGLDIPLYCGLASPDGDGEPILFADGGRKCAGVKSNTPRPVIRLGYNLFRETGYLLTRGQPRDYSRIPTLERHIALLRDLILESGIPLVEIPPVPREYSYVAALTHDIDFFRLRDHRFDKTMLGFIYRASAGSVVRFFRGRLSLGNLLKNWLTLLELPLIYLGLRRDPWEQIPAYMELEAASGSTFFLIPFKGCAGEPPASGGNALRAAKYDIADLGDTLKDMARKGFEIALHGVDAWQGRDRAVAERDRVSALSGTSEMGVRIHWLYRNGDTANVLDDAGFVYDSTCGYNDAVGFRAGTAQAYRPRGAKRLMELPLCVQDTAMFYPDRMDLTGQQARALCDEIRAAVRTHGGALTLLWHDRSLAPERLWGEFYRELLQELARDRAWVTTAGKSVRWFLKRREAAFEGVSVDGGSIEVRVSTPEAEPGDRDLPGLVLRVHGTAGRKSASGGSKQHKMCMDYPLKANTTMRVELPAA